MRPDPLTRLGPDRPGTRTRIDPEIVSALRGRSSRVARCASTVKYRGSGKKGFDTVHPSGFLHGSRHYLVAWRENQQARDCRYFALSNIERVESRDRSFTRRCHFSLREYAERSFGVFQEKPVDVVWKFSSKVAPGAEVPVPSHPDNGAAARRLADRALPA